MQTRDSSINLRPTAVCLPTSICRKMNHSHNSMVRCSPSPRLSNLSWHPLPNLSLPPSLSQQEKWYPTTTKHSLKWASHNQKVLSKQLITPQLQELPTKWLYLDGARWWTCLVAKVLGIKRSILLLLGCWLKELGWLPHQTPSRYLPWNPSQYSCRHLGLVRHMTYSHYLSKPLVIGFPFSLSFFFFPKRFLSFLKNIQKASF